MADSEIAKLQEELKAAMAAEQEEQPKRITFKTHSPEGDLVTRTIKGMLSDMEKMNRAHDPFEQRVKKAKTLFNYIMANPNIIAYSTKLRHVSINKAHEMLDGDYSKYDDPEAASQLQSILHHFLTWTEETLPFNVHYAE
jgi:hypothetical protein